MISIKRWEISIRSEEHFSMFCNTEDNLDYLQLKRDASSVFIFEIEKCIKAHAELHDWTEFN